MKVPYFIKKNPINTFFNHEKGSIEVGKFANFTVYSDNLMEVPIEQVPEIMAVQTYIGGKRVN